MAPGSPSPKMSRVAPSIQGAHSALFAQDDLFCVSYQLHLLCVECHMGGCECCHAAAFLSCLIPNFPILFISLTLLLATQLLFQIRDDPVAAAVLSFTRGLVDTIIISSQQKQQNCTPDSSSLLRDFSFSVLSVVLSAQGLSALGSLLALPMEDWPFLFAKLKDDMAMEAQLLLKAAAQGVWWRQGDGDCFEVV